MANTEIRGDLKPLPDTPATRAPAQKRARGRVLAMGNRQVVREGLETKLWTDFFHNAMTVTWPKFFALLAAVFALLNLGFAFLFWLGDAPIANARGFADLFFFSVETTSTVGYGDMHPQTLYGHWIATLQGFIGMVLLAGLTGLVFARFSRPRARLIFARNPVLTEHDGKRTLMVRIANARNNFITDASAKLWLIRSEKSSEGRKITRFHQMHLERSDNPVFALSWTLFHVIDAGSPLYGVSAEEIGESEMSLVISLSGLDETSAQNVHARNAYASKDVLFDHEYLDIINVDENGLRHVDYSKFHDTRPVSVG
jgi:inward rectifier potassium channel